MILHFLSINFDFLIFKIIFFKLNNRNYRKMEKIRIFITSFIVINRQYFLSLNDIKKS